MADCIHIPHETLPSCKQCGVAITSAQVTGGSLATPAPLAKAPPPVFKPATARVAEKLSPKGGKG